MIINRHFSVGGSDITPVHLWTEVTPPRCSYVPLSLEPQCSGTGGIDGKGIFRERCQDVFLFLLESDSLDICHKCSLSKFCVRLFSKIVERGFTMYMAIVMTVLCRPCVALPAYRSYPAKAYNLRPVRPRRPYRLCCSNYPIIPSTDLQ